jgi:hypothetical protein
MRTSAFLISALSTSVVSLVVPRITDDNVMVITSFDTAKASIDEGFIIPQKVPTGLYSVTVDVETGFAHHTKLESPDVSELPESTSEPTTSGVPASPLVGRQSWQATCPSPRYALNRDFTDNAVSVLKWSCRGDGCKPGPNVHYYFSWGNVVAYVCNFTSDLKYTVYDWMISQVLQEQVSQTCGAYNAGWSTFDGKLSIGQEYLNTNSYFCGRNH